MTGTRVVYSLVTIGLLALDLVHGGVALGSHRRQLGAQLADLFAKIRRLPVGSRQVTA